jgi:hypothetical protein
VQCCCAHATITGLLALSAGRTYTPECCHPFAVKVAVCGLAEGTDFRFRAGKGRSHALRNERV